MPVHAPPHAPMHVAPAERATLLNTLAPSHPSVFPVWLANSPHHNIAPSTLPPVLSSCREPGVATLPVAFCYMAPPTCNAISTKQCNRTHSRHVPFSQAALWARRLNAVHLVPPFERLHASCQHIDSIVKCNFQGLTRWLGQQSSGALVALLVSSHGCSRSGSRRPSANSSTSIRQNSPEVELPLR